jgi:hypothetical protein
MPAAGCYNPETRSVVSSTTSLSPPRPAVVTHSPIVPVAGTEESARRVSELGQQIIQANPQIGLRPLFTTVGANQTEVFHHSPSSDSTSTGLRGSQVTITEGLVKQCKTDAQLSAVLAYELGRMVAERENLASPGARQPDPVVPPDVPVGNDGGGPFGSADGTRMMELAKIDRQRHHRNDPPPPPLDPYVLARGYLTRAGVAVEDLDEVRPLLEKAEQTNTLERVMQPR